MIGREVGPFGREARDAELLLFFWSMISTRGIAIHVAQGQDQAFTLHPPARISRWEVNVPRQAPAGLCEGVCLLPHLCRTVAPPGPSAAARGAR